MSSNDPFKMLWRRLGFILLFYLGFRLLFLIHNWDSFSGERASALAWALLHGLRFDVWSIFWFHLPVILSAFLPVAWQAKGALQKALLVYVMSVNMVGIGLNVIDMELYQFTHKRMAMDWLYLQQDVHQQGWSLVSYYWGIAVLGFGLWFLLWWGWPRWQVNATRASLQGPGRWQFAVKALATLGLVFLGLRGGWQLKPLHIGHAFTSGSAELGALTLNSTFSFFKNSRITESLALRFYPTEQEAMSVLAQQEAQSSRFKGQFKDFNVVVLIVESLASEYMGVFNDGRGYTPFLDELSKKSMLFRENFANGRRSIEAVPSLLCGVPSLMNEPLIVSPFQGNELHCLGDMAKRQGYQTLFLHGAHNGSMHFDSFAARAGFDRYLGFNEYPEPGDSDGTWGIFDEPFLQYAIEQFDQIQGPFLASIFTLTSHHPYRVPPQYQGQFPKGELEIHPSIGYVDHALRKFFERAEKSPWFKQTIFIITGDHTHKSADPRYQDLLGGYRVPLLIYAPGVGDLRGDEKKITQHVDILPTVVDLLDWSGPKTLFGQSVFAPGGGLAYNNFGPGFWLLQPEWLVVFHEAGKRWENFRHGSSFDLKPESTVTGELVGLDGAQSVLKAVIHYFNWGIINNQFYPESARR